MRLIHQIERVNKPLKLWQTEGLQYAIRRGRRGSFLAMEMRLGKTLVAVNYLEEFINPSLSRPCLIVAPNTVTRTWANELKDFGQNDFALLRGDWKERLYTIKEGAKYIICNYEGLIPMRVLNVRDWSAVIADESLCIANPKSLVSKYMTGGYVTEITSELRKDGKKKRRTIPRYEKKKDCVHIALNGNPVPENALQIFQQIKFVQGSIAGIDSYWEFVNTYFTKSEDGHSWIPKAGTADFLYNAFHSAAFVRTRKECNVGSEKVYTVRYVSMTLPQRKAYISMKTHFEADGKQVDLAITQLEYMEQIAAGHILGTDKYRNLAKFNEVLYLLDGELHSQQVLVWFKYTQDIFKMQSMLNMRGYSCAIIYGEVDPEDREIIRADFQRKKYQVVCMQIQTGKRGLDFSEGDASIFLNNVWSSDSRRQAEDRLIHILKSAGKLIIDVLTEDSIDEHVHETCKEKGNEAEFFMNKLLWRMNHART